MPDRPAPTISTSRCSGVTLSLPWSAICRLQHTEGYSRLLQPCEKNVTHRGRSRHLSCCRRQLVEGEAEARLGQHLRGLSVTGIAAGHFGYDPLAAAVADELDPEPAALALGLVGAL